MPCWCLCLRPQQYKRLVSSVYPRDCTGKEEGLIPQNLSKLTQYATTHQSKIRLLGRWARFITRRAQHSLSQPVSRGCTPRRHSRIPRCQLTRRVRVTVWLSRCSELSSRALKDMRKGRLGYAAEINRCACKPLASQ